MKTVIMAGGRGTRISAIAPDIPKPMIKIAGVPVLEREIESLRQQGFDDLILTVGYLGGVIQNYFGDGSGISPATGKPFGVKIKYFVEDTPLGNAGALFKIKDELTEDFLLLNADAVFDVDFNRFVSYHKERGGLATLFTHPNSHPYDSGLIVTDDNGAVVNWYAKEDERPAYYHNRVNAGLHVLSPKVLEKIIDTPKVDLDRQILKPLVGTGVMFAYDSPEYVKDMGTPDRYESVCRDFENGIVTQKNLLHRQKAIFLDRDGTINEYVGFLRNASDMKLLPKVGEAVKLINASGYLAIVASNQPVIARGETTVEELDGIHAKMETLLGEDGAYLDGLYYCPHHPDKGFAGERPEYKIVCDCRKPKPGLLIKAAEKFNIDLSLSYMIGDRGTDVECGKNAGCKTAYIGEGNPYGADVYGDSLYECVKKILS